MTTGFMPRTPIRWQRTAFDQIVKADGSWFHRLTVTLEPDEPFGVEPIHLPAAVLDRVRIEWLASHDEATIEPTLQLMGRTLTAKGAPHSQQWPGSVWFQALAAPSLDAVVEAVVQKIVDDIPGCERRIVTGELIRHLHDPARG